MRNRTRTMAERFRLPDGDLVTNVSYYIAPNGPSTCARVQVQTLSGRLYHHKKVFVAGSPKLFSLLATIKARVSDSQYCVNSLDSSWWNDVTDLITKKEAALGVRRND